MAKPLNLRGFETYKICAKLKSIIMITDKNADNIADVLDKIAKKINSETGKKIMITFSVEGGGEFYIGGVKAGDPDYAMACKMAVGMTTFISGKYGYGQLEE